MASLKDMMLPPFTNRLKQLLSKREYVILFSMVAYLAIISILYPLTGGSIFALSVFPAAVLGVYGGTMSGILIGPIFLLINWLLFILLDVHSSIGQFIAMGGLIGSIATATVGSGIGYVASLNRRLNEEIAGREQAQQSLNKLNQKLEHQTTQALQTRAHFLTAMSHKLRTPLNASVGISTLLLDTGLDNVQSNYVQDLQRSNSEVNSIINSILEYTKAESGEIELNKSDFDLANLFDELQSMVQSKANERNVNLNIAIDPSVPMQLVGDTKKLHLILHNLLNNALDATHNGTVTLQAELKQPESDNLERSSTQTRTIAFSIVDTGKGIATEELENIFEPFSNSYQTTTQADVGAGIGMALCQRLCQNMGGQIQAQSTIGSGTTITATLPFEQSQSYAVSNSSQPDQNSTAAAVQSQVDKQQKILLAEDNILNAKVALKLLEKLGYTAHWVKDGQEAVDAVTESAYDLILMDIQMPRLDGLEATKEIRKRYEKSDYLSQVLCIIALTADTTLEDFSKQQAYGFDGFIGKPMSAKVLEKALNKVFHHAPLSTS